jgi:hypothetical protein
LENGASGTKQVAKAEAGTAEYLIELEERRSIKVTDVSSSIPQFETIAIALVFVPNILLKIPFILQKQKKTFY